MENRSPDFLPTLSVFSEENINRNIKRLKIQTHTQPPCWHQLTLSTFQEIKAPRWNFRAAKARKVNKEAREQKPAILAPRISAESQHSVPKKLGKEFAHNNLTEESMSVHKRSCMEVHRHLKSKQISSTHSHEKTTWFLKSAH